MKRTKKIQLFLLGGLSVSSLAGCGNNAPVISEQNVYTNNVYVPGVGYYHAPFRGWYNLPYNHFDPQSGRYFFGGQWEITPHVSITNISEPTSQAVQQAQAQRTDIHRGGFGSRSHSHYYGHS